MAKKKQNLSFRERLAQQAEVANDLKQALLQEIEKIDLKEEKINTLTNEAVRTSINTIYKIRNAMNTIRMAGDKDVLSVIVSSDITKDFILEGIKLEEVFNSINLQNQRISKSGDFEKMKEGINAAIETKKSVEKAMEELKDSIMDAFRKGFGNRKSIEEVRKLDKRKKIEEAISEMASGTLPIEVQSKFELTDNDMGNVVTAAIEPFIESHKADIVKATIKKEKLYNIAESLGLKDVKELRLAIEKWSETDAKLKKAIDDIKLAAKELREAKAKAKAEEKDASKAETEVKEENTEVKEK